MLLGHRRGVRSPHVEAARGEQALAIASPLGFRQLGLGLREGPRPLLDACLRSADVLGQPLPLAGCRGEERGQAVRPSAQLGRAREQVVEARERRAVSLVGVGELAQQLDRLGHDGVTR